MFHTLVKGLCLLDTGLFIRVEERKVAVTEYKGRIPVDIAVKNKKTKGID